MSRLTFVVLLLVAGIAAVGVFVLKHEVQRVEQQLAQVNQRIVAGQEALHVLKAEWSYLNQPERLKDLASRHLGLEPLAPGQIVRFEDVPFRAPDTVGGVYPDSSRPATGSSTLASAGARR